MKKIIYIMAALLVALYLTVGVYAEDITTEIPTETAEETATETAESPTETETETVAEMDTETAAEPADELAELLGASTPEQVEIVKQYLLYGLQTLPFSERAKLALMDHIDIIAWILVSLAFVVMGLLTIHSNKRRGDDNKTMTDNATALYGEGVERSEAAAKSIEESETRIANITTAAFTSIKEAGQASEKTLRETSDKLFKTVKESIAEAAEVVAEAKAKETVIAEATLTMCDLLVRLINDSDIPEADRDAYTRIYTAAIERIKEVTDDERKED
jgi:cytoskeletal protein RodZ